MKIGRFKGILLSILIIASTAVLLLLSINSQGPPKLSVLKGYENIAPDEAKAMIDSGQNIILLDVRTPAEYVSGHIFGAMLYSLQDLENTLPDLDKNLNIIIYCGTGIRSENASRILSENGFNHVYNLIGGLSAWEEAGFQVTDNNSENCPSCHQTSGVLFSQDYKINENGRGLGCLPENRDENKVVKLTLAGVPSSYDWRDYGVMTSVKNQGGCGSCVAFGTIGAFEAVIQVDGGPSTDLSEAHLFFCGGGNCTDGWYISTALNYLVNYGTPDESCFPYQDHDMSCSNTCSDWQVRARKILTWSLVAQDITSIKSALVSHGPLVARFDLYTDFYSYPGGVYHHTWGSLEGGHCVTIVGYNDSQSCWICKNSWGSSWGESGYFRMGYGECGIESYVAYITVDAVPPPAPSPNDGVSGWSNNPTPTFTWSVPSDASGIRGYYWKVDSGSDQWTTLTSVTVPTQSEGTHNFYVKAVDGSGNIGSYGSHDFEIDTSTPATPTITSSTHLENTWTGNSNPSFDWNDVGGPSPVTYYFKLDGYDSSFQTTSTSDKSYSNVPDGQYIFKVYATDTGGTGGTDNYPIKIDTTGPSPPQPLSPNNGENTNDNTPTLSWNAVSENSLPVAYRVWIDDDSGFTSPAADSGWISATNYTTAELVDNFYYWRVCAKDNVGNVGDNSQRTFRIDVTKPQAPTLLWPANGENINDNTPNLDWNTVTENSLPVLYRCHVSDNSAFPYDNYNSGWTSNDNFQIMSEMKESIWYWRVQAKDNAGNVGDNSQGYTFQVDVTAPKAPTLLELIDGTKTVDNTPTFRWTAVTDNSTPVKYDIEIDNDPDFLSPENSKIGLTDNSYTPSALPDENYSWRVRARDNAGNIGDWSSIWTLLIDTTPPVAPTLVWPANGENINDNSPILDWNSVPENSLPVLYRVHVSDNSQFPYDNVDSGWISDDNCITSELAEGVWYWRVQAKDNAGNVGDNSAFYSFRVDITAPPAPTLVLPENNAPENTLSITFAWTENESNDTYHIQVDNEAGFTSPYVYESSWQTENSCAYIFASNGTYYWRVRARDNAGNIGPWADNFKLTIQAPPTNPILISPANGANENDNTPIFTWIPGSNADNHCLLVDISPPDWENCAENILLGVTDNTYTPTAALADENYSWKVIAINSVGENESATWTLLIDTVPTTISEVTATNITQNSATITWTTDELSNSVVEYGTTTGYGSTKSDATLATSHSITLTGLSASMTYHYQVKSTDASGNTATSSDYTFTTSSPPPPPPPPPPPTDTTPPPTPSLVSPTDGATITDNIPLLDWSDVSDPSRVTYDLSIARDAGFVSIALQKTGLTTSAYELSSAEALVTGTYYWRVRAVDGVGNVGSWSENWSFTVGIAPIRGVGISILPAESEADNGGSATFSVTVTNTGGATDNYSLTVGDDAGWGPTLSENSLLNVENGASRTVTLIVAIPASAENDTRDNVTVTARSLTDNAIENSASCVVHCVVGIPPTRWGVRVSILPESQTGAPGENLTFILTIINTGTSTNTFTLTAMDTKGWEPTVSPASLTVPAGGNRTSTLSITIPSTAADGDSATITITAIGTGYENDAMCTATATKTAAPPAPPAPSGGISPLVYVGAAVVIVVIIAAILILKPF